MFQVSQLPCNKVIDPENRVAFSQERIAEMRSEKSCDARDHDVKTLL